MRRLIIAAALTVVAFPYSVAAESLSITQAINQAVKTNPGIGEVAANRRATEAELRQNQGTLLPQVRLETRAGPEKLTRAISPPPVNNGSWMNERDGSIVVRQLVFDGFSSINQIWQQTARVDAAASRVHEKSELIALDAAEAYIDVTRYQRLIGLAQDNLAAHRRVLSNVRARVSGGRSGEGDLQQAMEREESARAALVEFQNRLEDARAAFRKVVGLEASGVHFPGRLNGLPKSRDESLALALQFNPTIRAAQSDAKAAKYAYDSTGGAFVPNVYLEGRALRGWNSIIYDGRHDEVSGKVVVAWDIFRGGQDSWKRTEAGERMIEQSTKYARLQRDAFESVDKAWAARTITSEKAAALSRELTAGRKVVAAYSREYEIGQRTLVDLLNAENQQFNVATSLVSAQSVAVFADYQLLAFVGQLLNYLKTPHLAEAQVLENEFAGAFPVKVAPYLFTPPPRGPEPIKYFDQSPYFSNGGSPLGPATFEDRFRPETSTDIAGRSSGRTVAPRTGGDGTSQR